MTRTKNRQSEVTKEIEGEEAERVLHRRHPFMITLSIEEKALLSSSANERRITLSAYIRDAALSKAGSGGNAR